MKISRRDSIPLYKVIVLGDGGVGKTALTIQLCLNHFVETYDPTIEDSYRKRVVIDGQESILEVLDTAGQEEFTALRDQWIRDGEGFILVYSITSRSSFARIKNYYSQIQRVKEDDEAYSLVVVGNKSDKSHERQVSTQDGEALSRELGNVPFFESSAKLNINTEEAFFTCTRKCRLIRDPIAYHQYLTQQQHPDAPYHLSFTDQQYKEHQKQRLQQLHQFPSQQVHPQFQQQPQPNGTMSPNDPMMNNFNDPNNLQNPSNRQYQDQQLQMQQKEFQQQRLQQINDMYNTRPEQKKKKSKKKKDKCVIL